LLPATQDIDIYQGDDFDILLRLRNQNSDGTPGAYIDLTGYVGKAQLRDDPADNTVNAEFTVTTLNQTTTPGGILASLSHTQTAALPAPAKMQWDIQLTSPTGDVHTYLKGTATITAEVTR